MKKKKFLGIIEKTERYYWVNGYMLKGASFHTFAFSMLGFGFLTCWQLRKNKFSKRDLSLSVYKLI